MIPLAIDESRHPTKLWSRELRRLILLDALAFLFYYTSIIFVYSENELFSFTQANNYIAIAEFNAKTRSMKFSYDQSSFSFIFPIYPFILHLIKIISLGSNIVRYILTSLIFSSLITFSYYLLLRSLDITKRIESILLMYIIPYPFLIQLYSFSNQNLFFILICFALYLIQSKNFKYLPSVLSCMILTHRDGLIFVLITIFYYLVQKQYKESFFSAISLLSYMLLIVYNGFTFGDFYLSFKCFKSILFGIPCLHFLNHILDRISSFTMIEVPLFYFPLSLARTSVYEKSKVLYYFIVVILVLPMFFKFDLIIWDFSYIIAICVGIIVIDTCIPDKPSQLLRKILIISRLSINLLIPFVLSSNLISISSNVVNT